MSTDWIVVASGNEHKIDEIRAVLPDQMTLISQKELSIPSPEETGLTFVENAIIKARNAAALSQLPALADDSGLEVDYLKGEPGIYSSRYAGDDATDQDNNTQLLEALRDVPQAERTARFKCVIVIMRHGTDPSPIIASGTLEGEITTEPRGTGGFGYDPLFLVPALGKTVAELPDDEKNEISHRGLALAQLKTLLSL